ncbi:MAG: chemotaxis protein CheD [Actinobacteria bacterium]|nr:chemotaxis protein CheD [Actinomycetota bacterium]
MVGELKKWQIDVGLGELRVSKEPAILVSRALGSCVAVALYDKKRKIGGLAHIMLPKEISRSIHAPGKYADQAIPSMLKKMKEAGCNGMIVAKIAGGSAMFESKASSIGAIGRNNIEMVRRVLRQMGIPLVASDVGGQTARSVFFDTKTGCLVVRLASGKTKRL